VTSSSLPPPHPSLLLSFPCSSCSPFSLLVLSSAASLILCLPLSCSTDLLLSSLLLLSSPCSSCSLFLFSLLSSCSLLSSPYISSSAASFPFLSLLLSPLLFSLLLSILLSSLLLSSCLSHNNPQVSKDISNSL
jgi:hypothetical protein